MIWKWSGMPIETHEHHLEVIKAYVDLLYKALDEVNSAQGKLERIYDSDTYLRACAFDSIQCARMAIIGMIKSHEGQLDD